MEGCVPLIMGIHVSSMGKDCGMDTSLGSGRPLTNPKFYSVKKVLPSIQPIYVKESLHKSISSRPGNMHACSICITGLSQLENRFSVHFVSLVFKQTILILVFNNIIQIIHQLKGSWSSYVFRNRYKFLQ